MTPRDIQFSEIKPGQTVRAQCIGGYSVEGPIVATGRYLVFGSAMGSREIHHSLVERVELLAEPAPKYEVGQLAEVDWQWHDECDKRGTDLFRWDGNNWRGWSANQTLTRLNGADVIGEPRLLKAVPAGAPVLHPFNPYGNDWEAARLRQAAGSFKGLGSNFAADVIDAVADAVEAAQR